MAVVKSFGVMSVAKIYTFLLFALGLLEGIAISISMALDPVGTAAQAQLNPLLGLGYAVLIALPIIYAIVGFVVGAVGSWLYNRFASWVGGVEVELETTGSMAHSTPTTVKRRK